MMFPDKLKQPEHFQALKRACDEALIPVEFYFDYEREDEREYYFCDVYLTLKPSVLLILSNIKTEKGICHFWGSDLSPDFFREMKRLTDLITQNSTEIRKAA